MLIAPWFIADIADAVERGLKHVAQALDEEQAVRGIDALEEAALQPLIAHALSTAGYGVYRERRYPADRRKRKESEGERCDLVLTPDGRALRETPTKATLFEPADAVDLDEAFWLELKAVSQYTLEGANRNYASQLLSTVRQDVTKLSKDDGILHAGLLLVVFVAEERVAEHDLQIWQDRCLERGLPIGAPSMRYVPLTDRLGHRVCALALYPVSHL